MKALLCLACASGLSVAFQSVISESLALFIFLFVVLLWVTEAIPLAVTALLVPVLSVGFGVLPSEVAFAPFADEIIFLFLGAFLLAQAMQKHGCDRRLALAVLSNSWILRSLWRLALVIAILSFSLSMWVSNSATVAMLCPLVLGLCGTLEQGRKSENTPQTLRVFFVLLVAYAASIGGIATPIGSPPNLITIGFLEEMGVSISFLDWMSFGLPLAFLMLALSIIYLAMLFGRSLSTGFQTDLLSAHLARERVKLGPIKSSERQVLGCFVLAVLLWVSPGVLLEIFPELSLIQKIALRLSPEVVAIFCASILFFLPIDKEGRKNLEPSDFHVIDWPTVLLFGGGLSLGKLILTTGLATEIGALTFGVFPVGSILFFLFVTLTALLFTEVASNTASASIFIGILLGLLPAPISDSSVQLIVAVGLATSFGFMMPVATPPNAIAFGTGVVTLRHMMLAGAGLNLLGLLLLFLAFQVVGVLRYL